MAADVWSVTSWGELNRDGLAIDHHALRHPESVVVAVLEALADEGSVDRQVAVAAAAQYKIDDVSAADVSYKDTGSA
ncbi:Probable pyruvate dehydrogenase E1 component AceE [Mycobacteroides abscessus subsp. abscessus]|nr:Probable pyruvate dehydrogenase E1 component AceE [Mycobacteroides abscessus subsp. abscessus]